MSHLLNRSEIQKLRSSLRMPHKPRRFVRLYSLVPPHRATTPSERTSKFWRVRFLKSSGVRGMKSSGCITRLGAKDFARLTIKCHAPQVYQLHF